jgi:hypothetical protein
MTRQEKMNAEVAGQFQWTEIGKAAEAEYVLGTYDVLAPNGQTKTNLWLRALAHNAKQIGRRLNLRLVGQNQVLYRVAIDRDPQHVLVVLRKDAANA